MAILYQRTNIIAILLENGADPNRPDKYGDTPLMAALSDEDAVRLMLAHGADVNRRNNKGWSVLEQAHRECCHDAIPLMVAAGATL
jgi:ankyrin repeat protein